MVTTNPSHHVNPAPYVLNDSRIQSQARRVERVEKEIERTQRSVNNLHKQQQMHQLVMNMLQNANFYNTIKVSQGVIVDISV